MIFHIHNIQVKTVSIFHERETAYLHTPEFSFYFRHLHFIDEVGGTSCVKMKLRCHKKTEWVACVTTLCLYIRETSKYIEFAYSQK